jgi:group I intron endonuclease
MTKEIISIYIIYYDDPVKCYIGQSIHTITRFKKHAQMLLSGKHHSYKLQEEYNNRQNLPTMEVLEECNSAELNDLEIFYIVEFDSIYSGFNILSGGKVPIGHSSSRSKYSQEELIDIFMLLSDDSLTNKDISEITGQSIRLVETLAYGKRHIWLNESYPEIREKIDKIISSKLRSSLCNDYNARTGVVYTVISPTGVEYSFSNISRFSVEHNLNRSHLNQVILGKEMQHKGWRKGASDV